MLKKLTLTIDEAIYNELQQAGGSDQISHFVEELVRPHVLKQEVYAGYQAMASDVLREQEALDWAESTCQDVSSEAGDHAACIGL